MKRTLLFLLTVLFTVNCFSQTDGKILSAQKKYQIFDTHSKSEAVFRSFVVPGWGQMYNKQQLKGYIFLCGQTMLIGSYFYFNQKYSDTYNNYSLEKDPTKTAKLFDDAESAKNRRNLIGYAIAGTWILGMVDAYVFGWDNTQILDLSLSIIDNQPTISISLSLN
ncbi:MAG: DUF5683 domain-containing protein [Ignavibacteriales bacterium]|nr:DUF5683 domain-containing protein [Ignavibacteriales bacterium]